MNKCVRHTWHLALGTWHLALGTWHLALGTWQEKIKRPQLLINSNTLLNPRRTKDFCITDNSQDT
ncbi:hypothetical protein [Vibrio coralliirubri]|uniref:hypothetical protein n=1 Tax=Vibrio coralliirubri TaxID=1516159 RepID=UPI00065DEA8D|nr:hypothetical protein [Vibrio coralliirubri]